MICLQVVEPTNELRAALDALRAEENKVSCLRYNALLSKP